MTVEAIAGFVRGRIRETQMALRQAELDLEQWGRERGFQIEVLQERLRTLQEVLEFVKPSQDTEWLTRAEAAELLGTSPSNVSNYVGRARSGQDPDPIPHELMYVKGVLRLRFPKEELIAWWKRRRKKGRDWAVRVPRGWVRVREAAEILGRCRQWLSKLAREGLIPHRRIRHGKRFVYIFPVRELRRRRLEGADRRGDYKSFRAA